MLKDLFYFIVHLGTKSVNALMSGVHHCLGICTVSTTAWVYVRCPPLPGYIYGALLENLTDDAIAELYVTKYLIISLYLTKLYVT